METNQGALGGPGSNGSSGGTQTPPSRTPSGPSPVAPPPKSQSS